MQSDWKKRAFQRPATRWTRNPVYLDIEGDITKVEELVKKSLEFTAQHEGSKGMKDTPCKNAHFAEHVSEDEPARKKPGFDHVHLDIDTESILIGEKLNALHIAFVQHTQL